MKNYLFDYPTKPAPLLIYEKLMPRMFLSKEDHSAYTRLMKGYKGECVFASFLTRDIRKRCIPIFSLRINPKTNEAQLDLLLLLSTKILHFEIKFFSGDYFIQDEHWHMRSGLTIDNPLRQLERGKEILERLLYIKNIQLPVESYLAFVHHDFRLFQAPMDKPILYLNQIEQFLQKEMISRQIQTASSQKTAHLLKSQHIQNSKHDEYPSYSFSSLKKDIFCPHCQHSLIKKSQRLFICMTCQQTFDRKQVLLNQIEDFRILFPEEPLSSSILFEWFGRKVQRRVIYRLLFNHYRMIETSLPNQFSK